jgi:hypothetical protein
MKDFIVIQDTREQQPWDFSYFPGFAGLEKRKMEAGDYTIFGQEKRIIIERKKSTGEIAINFGKKLSQFQKEMHKLYGVERKIIVCEFPLDHIYSFPVNSGIPSNKHKYLQITANYLAMKIDKFKGTYGIEFIFSGNKTQAEMDVYNIFQEILLV